MDCNPQTPQFLSQSLLDTPELGRRAEANLSDPADSPNYGLAALRLVAETSVDEQTRQCAAVNFKNHVKTRWLSSSATPIPDGEKEQIKTLIVPLMLCSTRKIQAQFSEALDVIGNHDFPQFWPALLPDLESSLEKVVSANDFASVNGILATVNSLFKRFRCEFNSLSKKFRYEFKSNPVLSDLIYCSDNFAAPLLSTVKSISREINASVGSVTTLRQLLEAGRLCCRIFYSLNFFDVPENFEDKADEWMDEFKKYLTVATEDGGDADCLSLVDDLRAAVCENLILYMEKREGLLQKHLSDFVEAVCSLLVVATASERLTVSGIKFVSIVSKSVDHHEELFGGYDLLQQIVIPNMMLRDEDEELFEKNWRDMEGNGGDTRRRIACELLKGISGKYKEKITEQIHNCLALFAENPTANWKYKECAIYMVVSLSTTDHVVDVESFFKSVIVPELQCEDVNNTSPMLKAAALKFFTVLRVSIPKHAAMPAIGDVVRYVRSDVRVVRSYAAICIEKLLLVKDYKNGVQLPARYTSMDMGPIFEYLIFNLFGALEKVRFLAKEKESMMRCIGRVLQMADIYPKIVSQCIVYLTKTLTWVCCDRTNPVFNHLVFEAVATLVRRACEKNPSAVTDFKTCILNIFRRITCDKVTELYPYACQLLAQLVDLNTPPPLPPLYMQIFDDMLLGPALWDDSANVPALVHLLQSFLQQAPLELLNREGRLTRVIGKIEKLVSSSDTEEEGFRLLNTVIGSYGYDVIAEYMNQIWVSVFNRLQNSKTPRLVRCFIISMSLFLVKHGFQTLVDLIDSVEPKLFHVILGEFWIPNLKTITGYTEVKLSAVASTKVLYESASLLDPAAEDLWGKLLDAIVTLLSLPLPEEETADDDDDDEPILTAYQGSKFVRLKNVGKKEEVDPLMEIEDPKKFLVGFPANISSEFRGRFPLVLTKYLSPPNQAALVKLCNSYNIAIL